MRAYWLGLTVRLTVATFLSAPSMAGTPLGQVFPKKFFLSAAAVGLDPDMGDVGNTPDQDSLDPPSNSGTQEGSEAGGQARIPATATEQWPVVWSEVLQGYWQAIAKDPAQRTSLAPMMKPVGPNLTADEEAVAIGNGWQ